MWKNRWRWKSKKSLSITEKYRGVAHQSCNLNLKLTKKVSINIHNLKRCDSHLIMNEIGKFNVKVDVIPNALEKYMTFTVYKNLVFIDSKQFIDSSLEKLVKNLSDNDFKHLAQELGSENLKMLDACPYEYMDSFERFSEKKFPVINVFMGL